MMKKVLLGFLLVISSFFLLFNIKVQKNTMIKNDDLAVYVDNELMSSIPKKGEALFSKAVCDDENASYYWDTDSWGFFISNMNKKTKCNLYFVTYSGQTVFDFDYTGGEQIFTVPVSGTYKLETWGAQGGDANNDYTGGFGGYSTGNVHLDMKTAIYINSGAQGTKCTSMQECSGGYNGGGNAKAYSEGQSVAAGGGGATHISIKSGLLSTLDNYKSNILIVSGGGGGGHFTNTVNGGIGGSGGGLSGVDYFSILNDNVAAGAEGRIPSGGTQTKAGCSNLNVDCGNFGKGGNSSNTVYHNGSGSGGGGGYYGGSGANIGPGGGGSGYIGNPLLKEKVMYCYNCEESSDESTKTISTTCSEETPTEKCSKKGNGYAKITLVSIDE